MDRQFDIWDRFSSVPADEGLAALVARFVLMPRRAVILGFEKIGGNISSPTATDIFRVSSWLGVGYTSLLHQMHWTLNMLSSSEFQMLLAVRPQALKRKAAPATKWEKRKQFFEVCSCWEGERIHAEIGDVFAHLSPSSMKHFASEV